MKRLLSGVLLVSGFSVTSQTGPAGVGTSSNNVFWIKANAGTSSTVNGTPLSGWNDQSGNSISMTQTIASQQPSFVTNVINGFPAVQFDNVTSTNDKMIGPDLPILDNTSFYTFFTVTRPQVVDGAARVIISKRTTVSVDQSFMLFYYTGNKIHVDIQTTDDRFTTNYNFFANNNYIFDVVYNGSLPTASRVAVYVEESFDRFATETASIVPDNASPIILGTTDASDPRPFGGYISEVIIYRDALTPAQRIIVNNYLSAKYNIALSANDKYAGDNAGNGDYDFDVAGVGSETPGSSTSFSPSIAAGLGISVTAGLDAGDYIMAGHPTAVNSVNQGDVGGMTGVNNGRWERIWYVDVTNTLTAMTTNIQFDMSDGSMGAVTPAIASNYVLLYRAGQSGNWTELTTASSVTGDRVLFNGVSLATDGYYTLGSRNITASPLPVELLYFTAKLNDNRVELTWSTASEKNNKEFTVEKTYDGIHFETVATLPGAGTSSMRHFYSCTDDQPYDGLSYYRLKQTDLNNGTTYSPLVPVETAPDHSGLSIFPNPNDGILNLLNERGWNGAVKVEIYDAAGKLMLSRSFSNPGGETGLTLDTGKTLSSGSYSVKIINGGSSTTRRIVFR